MNFRSGNILQPSRNCTYTRSSVLNASNCLLHVSPKAPTAQILESLRLLTRNSTKVCCQIVLTVLVFFCRVHSLIFAGLAKIKNSKYGSHTLPSTAPSCAHNSLNFVQKKIPRIVCPKVRFFIGRQCKSLRCHFRGVVSWLQKCTKSSDCLSVFHIRYDSFLS